MIISQFSFGNLKNREGGCFYYWTQVSRIAAAAAKSLQLCPTLCDLIDSSPPGSPVPAILQARTLEWVAISFSNAWKWKNKVKSLSRVWLLATPWTAAHQAPLSMGFSRQAPALQVDSLPSEPPGKLIRCLDLLIHSLAYNTIITWSPDEIMNILEFILTPFGSRI